MEFRNLLNVQNRDELRQWLLENYNKEPECWVVVKRGRPVDDETFWYIDAVEEAMCFGWIDIVNIGLHFFLKNVRPYAASCSEA